MSELAEELAELKRCGEVLISISETLTQMFSSPEITQPEQTADKTQKTETYSGRTIEHPRRDRHSGSTAEGAP